MLESTAHPAATTQLADEIDAAVWDAAVADHLGFYRDNTRQAYEADLRIFTAWCRASGIAPLRATRMQVEAFLAHCETDRGNGYRTLQRRMSTLRRLYALLAEDDVISKSPVVMARLRRRYESQESTDPDLGLDRFDLSALWHAAAAASPVDHALVALMAGLGLRVSEACGLSVGDVLHMADSHRVARFAGKGGKLATVPIPPQVWRAIAPLTKGDHREPLLMRPCGRPMNRVAAARVVARLGKAAGIERHVHPHLLRAGYVSGVLDAGGSIREAQAGARHSDPRMTARYDRRSRSLDLSPNYRLASWIAGAS